MPTENLDYTMKVKKKRKKLPLSNYADKKLFKINGNKVFLCVLFLFERRYSKCATPLFPPVDTILTALFVGSSTLQIIGVTNKER